MVPVLAVADPVMEIKVPDDVNLQSYTFIIAFATAHLKRCIPEVAVAWKAHPLEVALSVTSSSIPNVVVAFAVTVIKSTEPETESVICILVSVKYVAVLPSPMVSFASNKY
jgi:hypothetical protein